MTDPKTKPAIEADVRHLVIAARRVAYGDNPVDAEAMTELDQAAEAFASRVPWGRRG